MIYFHTNIIIPPDNIPAITPYLLAPFQNSDISTTGPKVAPKPAHANDTISNTELFGSLARSIAITDIIITVVLATTIDFFSVSLTPKNSCKIFCDTLDAEARSCESAVDIVAASIPASITPAHIAGSIPYVLRRCAILTIIVSA